jgi:ABC-type cobalamin/Fe3+-siderophores transport system ATPase subunit
MKRYERGSEWRKWDLHLHVPGTKLADGYGSPADWDRFCQAIESSDVAAFGITDYFAVDSILEFVRNHVERYPDTDKTFFPNVELRLNEVVNGANQQVNLHVLFRPEASPEQLHKFLSELKTQITDANGRQLRCSELRTEDHFKRATVTRADLQSAIEETFGRKIDRTDHVLVMVPANNDGIRAQGGALRRRELADEIDKFSDAVLGNSGNRDWFLREDRFDDGSQRSVPKPVFACCDAHSFDQLEHWLGRSINEDSARKEITWIKADPTYDGLLQTLIEPESRVAIADSTPDYKEPYKYIAAIHFNAADEFPATVPLNQNLVSIIGSRSSGKSALLAYIAHTVDPEYTIAQQVAVGAVDSRTAGPAAGKTWSEVASIDRRVEWGDARATTGKVIYIPQNSLFSVSGRPEDITAKIQPALYRLDPEFEAVHSRVQTDVQAANAGLATQVTRWFELQELIERGRAELRDLGDPAAVAATRDSLGARIAELRAASSLSPEDVAAYQALVDELGRHQARIDAIAAELVSITPYVSEQAGEAPAITGIEVTAYLSPAPETFPPDLEQRLSALVAEALEPLRARVDAEVLAYLSDARTEHAALTATSERLRQENADLIARNQANAEIEALVVSQVRQSETLAQIQAKQKELDSLQTAQATVIQQIKASLAERARYLQELVEAFTSHERRLDDMTFGIEQQVTEDDLLAASNGFNRQENTDYFDRSSELVDLDKVVEDPRKFLVAIHTGTQKLKRGMSSTSVAIDVLTVTPQVRFTASLEADRIGGFQRSSMTPGKQALFALTLILNESTEAWPLLIDQPEDDLDSRSIWYTIVPYLMTRKRERQIIMASHDANLVIGADSEQVIVANRHGEDRKNRDGRAFAYLSGSLEHSQGKSATQYVLESCGIREHACDILDGGEPAFRKRKEKYNF